METMPVARADDPRSIQTALEMQCRDPAGPPPEPTSPQQRQTPLTGLWRRHVALDVPFEACRDHYALERTYLAWLRTSVKFAHFGVLVAQLFRLPQHLLPSSGARVSDFYRLGKFLGVVCISIALFIVLTGCFRCWQQQRYIVHGKVRGGGWEIWAVVIIAAGCIFVLLVLVVRHADSDRPG